MTVQSISDFFLGGGFCLNLRQIFITESQEVSSRLTISSVLILLYSIFQVCWPDICTKYAKQNLNMLFFNSVSKPYREIDPPQGGFNLQKIQLQFNLSETICNKRK